MYVFPQRQGGQIKVRASNIFTLSHEAEVREAVFAARFEREAFPKVHYRGNIRGND